MTVRPYKASVIIIGDEILTGKTKEANIQYIANNLSEMGIELSEARIIPDRKNIIISTVQELCKKEDFIFSTGGIGPTHDDITSEAIAEAFNRKLEYNKEALNIISEGYMKQGKVLNEGSKRMALMPSGVELIMNSASIAPGYRIENLYVMAGIPWVMQAMFSEIRKYILSTIPSLGSPYLTENLELFIGEGIIAALLKKIQDKYHTIAIGSYPFKQDDKWGTNISFRSKDKRLIKLALEEFKEGLKELEQ